MDDFQNMGFRRLKDFLGETDMKETTWATKLLNGQVPPCYELSKGAVGYLKSDIQIFLKFVKLYKRPRHGQLWIDIKKMMLEKHPD
jgi:hypothetical protein